MKALCTIYEVRTRRKYLNGSIEDFTWHLFRNKQGTIAGGTFHPCGDYAKAVFIRVPRYSTLHDIAPLVYTAVGREEPYAVADLGKDTWIISIDPFQDHNKIPYRATFNLFEQPQDEAKRRKVAPLMIP